DLVARLGAMARAPLHESMMKSTRDRKPNKTGVAYEREFERYLVRLFLEPHPEMVAHFLDSSAAENLPLENRLLVTLALEPKQSAVRVAKLLPQLTHAPREEEILRLAQFPDQPGVQAALQKVLQQPATKAVALDTLLKFRTQLDPAKLTAALTDAARSLIASTNT